MSEEIIAALATAWGEGGISIVRISGEGCTALADEVFYGKKPLRECKPRYLALGKLRDREGYVFDEALAARFTEGASYSGEESVEIHCHGGALPAQRCVEELCFLGARLANPGEFTRRAFVNGRIDLAQAEAVLGLIRSRSDEALRASARTLQGGFTAEIKNLLTELTTLAARLEVDLDFPEEGEGLLSKDECAENIAALIKKTEDILSRSRSGLLLREGIKVAIIGRPNVGKSSLLNALLKEARAIVTPIPGTTRDRIEEIFTHKGVPIRIIDTAGIRKTSDEVESIGVSQSLRAMREADLRVWVVDAAEPLAGDELELGEDISAQSHIIVLNKHDLPKETSEADLKEKYPDSIVISVSALRSEGIEALKDAVVNEMTQGGNLFDSYGVTSRQMQCLTDALAEMSLAESLLKSGAGDDLVISCVAGARSQLAALLGLDPTEELLDIVFSSFCVGK